MNNVNINYKCPKCGNTGYETDEIRTTGGMSRFFDIQNKKFTAVTCNNCKYTELYKAESGLLGNIFDLFTS